MLVGTLSLMQKGQTSGCSGCSGIVVYGGGHIVFGADRSNQWTQWMQWMLRIVICTQEMVRMQEML